MSLRIKIGYMDTSTNQIINSVTIEENEKFILNSVIKKKFTDYEIITASIDEELVDLSITIEKDCEIILYGFDSKVGKEVFWHSSAHILGNALKNLYDCKLVNGPATEEGFYYDVEIEKPIKEEDLKKIEKEMIKLAKKGTNFKKIIKTKKELLKMYEDNSYKKYFINKNVNKETSVYYNIKSKIDFDFKIENESNLFFDMCLGPHINNTSIVKSISILKSSSCYFLNDSKNSSLQRIYGISFPNKKMMTEYNERIKKCKEMDHRKIEKEMNLFFFHEYSAGSCFWLPEGAFIYNKLIEYLRNEYRTRNFKEVITPNIFSLNLWKESGHYENYIDNIYTINDEDFALKPMNCPGHCLIYKNDERSFKELPLRFADFGVLHRNEITGSLSGLTRVRRFQQDDAHIFCKEDQIKVEIKNCLDFIKSVYSLFNFKYEIFLSTRPEKYIGNLDEWENAEISLKEALDERNQKFTVNKGDGAFYGPKLDIILNDIFNRKIQCATIQLDFQLPKRFDLKFKDSDGNYKRPVMIHRAIFGSLERMISIIIENFGKNLPFWLSPRQIAIIPIFVEDYAESLKNKLFNYEVKIFNQKGDTLNKKIRKAETEGFKLICVVGNKEFNNGEINLRIDNKNISMKVEYFMNKVKEMVDKKIEFYE